MLLNSQTISYFLVVPNIPRERRKLQVEEDSSYIQIKR
jgi:hypothetical protein